MAWSPIVEALFYPVLVVSQAVPKIAVAPLFLVWLGFGMATNAVLALLVAVFPVIVNTLLGLTSLDANYIKLGRIMGANSWRLFVRIRLPAALPSIFAGLKVAMTLATIGAIVGELISGQRGLGGVVQTAAGQAETTLAFAAVAALSLLGIVLFYAVALAEKIVVRHG
jgi:NitT/TauT family transport system permease protein